MVNNPLRPIAFSGGVKSVSDDDLCATCKNCQYVPGELSGCSLSWPGSEDGDGYVQECSEFKATSDGHQLLPTISPNDRTTVDDACAAVEAGASGPEGRSVLEIEFDNQTVADLAKQFVTALRSKVGDDVYLQIVALNKAETDPGICHSHDFVDANMVMAMAFTAVTGTEVDVRSSSQSLLWNRSWTQAVRDMKL